MSSAVWVLVVLLLIVVALGSSARLRKSAFIWGTYATLTGWYYFRVLQKKYGKTPTSPPASATRASKTPPSSATTPLTPEAVAAVGKGEPDVVYFESREVVARRQREQEQRAASERSAHMSDSGSSGESHQSDDSRASRKHRVSGLFRSRRKNAAEEAMRRVSDTSSVDLQSASGVSEMSASSSRPGSTRRTYTGRKKPVSWAD